MTTYKKSSASQKPPKGKADGTKQLASNRSTKLTRARSTTTGSASWQRVKPPGPKTKVSVLPEFDVAEYLESEEAMAAYLTQVLEEGDASELAHALGVIARARGMSAIASETGMTREALYKALRPGAQPRFDTISRVCHALGIKLIAQPNSQRHPVS